METIKNVIGGVAMGLPAAVCLLLAWRLIRNLQTDWKLATCISASALAASLMLLLGTDKILFLKYGDAVLEINQKKLDVEKLTEQNKRLAIETVKAMEANLSGVMASEGHDSVKATKALEDLLKAAGVSAGEIDRILERTNAAKAKP
jgi:hypothetical protein